MSIRSNLYGICGFLEARAEITSPKADRDLLMNWDSFSFSPSTSILPRRSLPAKNVRQKSNNLSINDNVKKDHNQTKKHNLNGKQEETHGWEWLLSMLTMAFRMRLASDVRMKRLGVLGMRGCPTQLHKYYSLDMHPILLALCCHFW